MGKWSWVGPAAVGFVIGAIIFSSKKQTDYLDISKRITPYDPEVRTKAIQIVKKSSEYCLSQLFDIFDYMHNLKYVSDPHPDYIALPRDTLKAGGGDCDDFAVTTSSLVKAIGGEARVVTVNNSESGHAFCEVLVSSQMDDVLKGIRDRYNNSFTIGWETDNHGNWLLFDTLLPLPGCLHSNFIILHNDTWKFTNPPKYFYQI